MLFRSSSGGWGTWAGQWVAAATEVLPSWTRQGSGFDAVPTRNGASPDQVPIKYELGRKSLAVTGVLTTSPSENGPPHQVPIK